MRIFLIGMPAVGKSSVGRHLARRLGVRFIDIDRRIEKSYRGSVTTIFAREGQWGFRVREAETLLELIRKEENCVVATGGGLPMFGENMALLLENGWVVHLRMQIKKLAQRPDLQSRPLLQASKNVQETLAELWRKRRTFYRRAHTEIICDDLSPNEIALDLYERARKNAASFGAEKSPRRNKPAKKSLR